VNAGRWPAAGDIGGFWMVGRRPRRSEIMSAVLRGVLEDRPLSEALGDIRTLLPNIGERFCITGWVEGEPAFTVGDRLPPSMSGRERRPGSPWDIAARTSRDFITDSLDGLDQATAALATREELGALAVVPVPGVSGATAALITIWMPARMATASALDSTAGIRELVAAAIRIRSQLEDLRRTARSDALTGLTNRRGFHDLLDAGAPERQSIVFYIDLDGFKAINDTHGHQAGDRLLQEVSERIKKSVRAADVVARLGGDEFAVLCRSCSQDEAVEMSQRILEAVKQPISMDGADLVVSASIGVAGGDPVSREMLHRADSALYEAKRAGRDTVRFSS
jgi:diguanylate cyclase (GGDEF)-like protein